jgi:hypothetical protein
LHKAREEGRCLRPKAEKKHVIDKWVIAYGERERMLRGRRLRRNMSLISGSSPMAREKGCSKAECTISQ